MISPSGFSTWATTGKVDMPFSAVPVMDTETTVPMR